MDFHPTGRSVMKDQWLQLVLRIEEDGETEENKDGEPPSPP